MTELAPPNSDTSQEIAHQSRVAIVGAGISGLSTAYYLQKQRPDLQLEILEASNQPGGILQTVHRNGFLIERGPDMFITRDPEAMALCKEIDFDDQLISTNTAFRGAYLVHRGKLQKMPHGWTMLTPTNLWSIARTPLLSLRGKFRVLGELFARKRKGEEDESLASFTKRRLGQEAFDNIIQPLIGGIYTADPDKLSMNATLKPFVDMERHSGGLIRGGLQQLRQKKGDVTSSGARYGMFVTPKDGMQSLAEAIAKQLPLRSLEYNVSVSAVRPHENGLAVTVDGESTPRHYDKVVLATSSQITSGILKDGYLELSQSLKQIPLAGASILSMGYPRSAIRHPLDAFGVIVPIKENRPLIAISFSSQKFPGRAPDDHVLFRVFIGGALQPELMDWADDQLIESTQKQLQELLGVSGEPLFTEITRWNNTMPQYHVGHVQLIDSIEQQLTALPNLELAGNAYRGVGIPLCVRSGLQAAQNVIRTKPADQF